MNIYTKKQRWKWVLFIIALLIIFTSLWYTNSLVKRIAEDAAKAVEADSKDEKVETKTEVKTEEDSTEVSKEKVVKAKQLLLDDSNEKMRCR